MEHLKVFVLDEHTNTENIAEAAAVVAMVVTGLEQIVVDFDTGVVDFVAADFEFVVNCFCSFDADHYVVVNVATFDFDLCFDFDLGFVVD